MGVFKRIRATHKENVARRDKKRSNVKNSRSAHREARAEKRFEGRDARRNSRATAHTNRVKARLAKRGLSVADQDEKDILSVFPSQTASDNNGAGFDSGDGSFVENSQQTSIQGFDSVPNQSDDWDMNLVGIGEEQPSDYDENY